MTPRSANGSAHVLVVGGGLAGMTAAHHLAEWGVHVSLVDSAPSLGGAFLLLDHTFTTDSCGLCIALPRQPSYCPTLSSDLHPRISSLTGTTLVALEGGPGAFAAVLRREPRTVDPERCDNCGACAAVCPATRPRSRWGRFLFDDPLDQKAIYPPPPRAVPYAYAIAPDACTRCGACVEACPQGAIDLNAQAFQLQIEVDAVLLAPGFAPFDAARAFEYGWGRCANVVTSLEFERMLNRSGPTAGQILRPSDGQAPERIAFVHCVGSRSEALDRPYCSTSCCMITAKQVGMAKQIFPRADVTVFTMDVRSAGKGYERYFDEVAALPAVTYRRGRPAAVHETPGDQNVRLLTPEGEEIFDLLVLSVGMGPAESIRELGDCAGVPLDDHGFILPGDAGPGSTRRAGIFTAGASIAPADVPETVTQAETAAALAASALLRPAHFGPDPTKNQEPGAREKDLSDEPPRVGVFLCACRGALAGVLEFEALVGAAEQMRGVAHVELLDAACEEAGLAAIEEAVSAHDLNRLVIGACSPRLYANRFEALMERLKLPPELLRRANIREGAAWSHERISAAATDVARSAVGMAVAALREIPVRPPLVRGPQWPAERVLVLGGGLAGMTAALTLAELGVPCDLVEREAYLGGNLRGSVHPVEGFGTGKDPGRLLEEITEQLERAERLRIWNRAQLAAWTGSQGDFRARIQVQEEVVPERYGALIVATGAEPAAPHEYLYGQDPRVVTQQDLDRALGDAPLGSSIGDLRSVVMLQCVGSRDEEHPYCSRVCCAHALQNAVLLKRRDPALDVTVLFRDIRTLGMRELLYQEARQLGVRFVRYEPPDTPVVEAGPDHLRITVRDRLYDETLTLRADRLVLSTGIAPRAGNRHLADLLGVGLDEDGFFNEAHPKLRPTDLPPPGVFVCGMAYGPRFSEESVAQARAAALRAALTVLRPAETRRDVAHVEEKLCSFCGLCVTSCPYGARVLDDDERVARVIDHLCLGCGTCTVVCPNGASRQKTFEPVEALALVDAALI
mgnify:CR=1 FL=1